MIRSITIGLLAFALVPTNSAQAEDKVSPEEIKATTELKKGAIGVVLDDKHPEKPVVILAYYGRTFDEKTIALINQMKHLKDLGGYDVKFKPGTLKLLKGHPTLESLSFTGTGDLAVIKELPDGPAIKYLVLGDAKYTTEHFETLAKVQSLRSIRVYLALIKPETLRPLHKLKHLETLSVTLGDPFSAADVAGFNSLVQLACIAPSNSEPFFTALAKIKTLRVLTLLPETTRELSATPPNGLNKIAAIPELTELTLRVPITDATLAALASSKNLTKLDIPSNGITATGIQSLAKLPALTHLRMAGKSLPESAVTELKNLTKLKELGISVGPLTEEGMKAISSISGLETLELGQFTPGADKAIPHITKLTKLRSLDLSFSDLTNAGLKQLVALKELTELKIGSTKTTPAGQAALQRALPKLKIINYVTTGFNY